MGKILTLDFRASHPASKMPGIKLSAQGRIPMRLLTLFAVELALGKSFGRQDVVVESPGKKPISCVLLLEKGTIGEKVSAMRVTDAQGKKDIASI